MDPDDNGFVPSQSLKQILVDLDMVDLANDETTLARLRGRYCYPTLVSRIYPTMPHTLLIHDDETTLARLRGRYYYLLYIAFIQNHPIIAMHAYLLASRYPLIPIYVLPTFPSPCAGHLQIDGEIILWSSLWENLSRLMANESTVDSLIDGKGLGQGTGLGQGSVVTPSSSSSSSSSVAMDLTGDNDSSSNSSSGVGSGAFGTGLAQGSGLVQGRPRSDSDFARELQAQWAAEDGQGQGLGQGLGEVNQWGAAYSPTHANDISNLVPNLIPAGTDTPGRSFLIET